MAALEEEEFQAPKFTFRGLAGNLQRIEAFRNQFDYAGVVEIIPQRVIEGFKQGGILRIVRRRLKVCDGQADLFHTQAGCQF